MSKQPKHTPGPWRLETVPTSIGACHKIGPFPGASPSIREETNACVYVDGGDPLRARGETEKELLANAFLMTASPDLYKALEAAEEQLDRCGVPDDHEVVVSVRDALASARGEGKES